MNNPRLRLAGVALGLCLFVALSLALPASGAAAAKGQTGFAVPKGKQVTISFAEPFATPTAKTAITKILAAFQARYPKIHVTDVPLPGSNAENTATLLQDAATGHLPDVITDGTADLRYDSTTFKAKNLDRVVGAQEVDSAFAGKYPIESAARSWGTLNGQDYALPITPGFDVLVYNPTLFQKAGLNPAKPPATWSQLATDAQKITSATGAKGLSLYGLSAGASDTLVQALSVNGGSSVFDNGTLTWTTKPLVTALSTLQGLVNKGVLQNLTVPQTVQAMASSQLAMTVVPNAIIPSLTGVTLRAAVLPSVAKTSNPQYATFGWDLMMTATAKLHQEAAWTLMKFMESPTAQRILALDYDSIPLSPSLTRGKGPLAAWYKTNASTAGASIQELAHAVSAASFPGANGVAIAANEVNAATAVVFQNKPARSTMAAAQQQSIPLLHSAASK